MSEAPAAAPATPAPAPDPAAAPAAAATPPAAAPAEGAPEAKATPPAAAAAPTAYDLKLPDDSPLDLSRVESITALAKERGLSNEAAQELLNGEHELVKAHEQKLHKQLADQSAAWLEALKADPEFGGDKLTENVEMGKRLIARYGDEELKAQLDSSGLGNHPGLVKLLSRIGREMAPDKLEMPRNTGGEKKSLEERLYPGQK